MHVACHCDSPFGVSHLDETRPVYEVQGRVSDEEEEERQPRAVWVEVGETGMEEVEMQGQVVVAATEQAAVEEEVRLEVAAEVEGGKREVAAAELLIAIQDSHFLETARRSRENKAKTPMRMRLRSGMANPRTSSQ